MRKRATIAVLALLAANAAWALTPANDVGKPVQPGPATGPGTPYVAGLACPPGGQVDAAFTGTHTQSGRIFRDGAATACPGEVYPGIFNAGTTYNYETFTYTNTSAATACVTVNFNPDTSGASPCATNAHASAYIGSYDPANQSLNYVGDVGSSITQPFSIDVPAGADLVLVVTNTSAQAVCSFGFEILNLPCTSVVEAELALTKTVAPASVPAGGNAVFTLTVTNNGPGAAANTIVTDTLPAGLTYVSNTCGASFTAPNVTWNAGTLANAASASCDVTVTVDQPGGFLNDAQVTSDGTDAVPANNGATATVIGSLAYDTVPTLSGAGLGAMLLGLSLAACWVLRSSQG